MKTKNLHTMLGIILILGLISTTSAGCIYGWGVDGNGNVVKENRDVSGFDAIEVSGAFDVYLTQGDKEELIVEADENLMELIKTEVVGNRLKIYTKKDIRKAEELNIYLTFKSLEEIRISGAVEIAGENKFKLDGLDIDASGASEIDLTLDADELDAEFSGASETELRGYVREVSFDCSGASEIDALDLETSIFRLDVSGASEARVYVNDELHIDASGASSVRYKGDPKIYQDVSGASSVKPY